MWVQGVGSRFVLAASTAVLVAACFPLGGPSEERLACLDRCGREKDTCVLQAMNSSQIQWCDAESRSCNAHCPY